MPTIDPRIMNLAVLHVRRFIRDWKHKNRLLLGEFESTDEDVRQAIMDALFDWNITPPPIAPVDLRSHPAKHLLIHRAGYQLLHSASIWHAREHLPSSDGGTSADDHAKFGEYSQLFQMGIANYEKKRDEIKVAINVANAYGSLGSEYAYDFYDWEYGLTQGDINSATGADGQDKQK